jgi:hypothetical protein
MTVPTGGKQPQAETTGLAHRATLWTHTRNVVVGTDALRQQTIPYLPRKDRGTFPLVVRYLVHYIWSGNSWFRAAYCPRLDRTCLIVPEICKRKNHLFLIASQTLWQHFMPFSEHISQLRIIGELVSLLCVEEPTSSTEALWFLSLRGEK